MKDKDLFYDIFYNVNALIFVHDLCGDLIVANRCFKETLGYSDNGLKDKSITDLIPVEYKLAYDSYIMRLQDRGHDSGKMHIIHKAGHDISVEYDSALCQGPEGRRYVHCICRNITEELKYQDELESRENKLKESERKFRDIFENINEGIYLHDVDGNFTDINTHFLKDMGYSKNELLARNIRDVVSEEYRYEIDNYLARIKANGFDKGFYNVVNKQGQKHIIEYKGSLVQGEDGPIAVRGVARDVTKQLRVQKDLVESQKRLKESEQKYRDIFENINEGIFIHDLDGYFIDTNPSFITGTGYPKVELLSKNIRDLATDKYRPEFDDYLARIKANGFDKGLFKAVTRDGCTKVVEFNSSLIQGKDGPIAVRGLAKDITEQYNMHKALKESQQKLKESEQKYRDIFENINEGIFIHDLDGYFIDTNPSFITGTGYSKGELLSKNVRDLTTEKYRPEFDEYLARIKANGFDKGLFKAVAKNGRTKVVEYNNSLIQGKDGPIAVRGLAKDITEQYNMHKALKESQKKLKESEQKYRDIFENINEGIFIHDLNGNFTNINTRFIKDTGYTKHEILDKNIRDVMSEQYSHDIDEYLKRIKANGFDKGLYNIVTKQGQNHILAYMSSLVFDEHGPVAVRGVSRDITEQLHMKKALKESKDKLKDNERKFRDIFENINEYLYITDIEGHFTDINPHFSDNMGYQVSELLDKNIRDLIPEEFRQEFERYLERIITNGSDKGLVSFINKQGRTRVVQYSNSLIQGEDGPVAIRGVARDITEEFKARSALQKSEEELRIARDHLEKRVQERTKDLKKSNTMLEEKTKGLEEANIALRVLLSKKDEAQKDIEERMLDNVKGLIHPVLTKMRQEQLNPTQEIYLDLIESNIDNIVAPFAVNITSKYYNLTSTEIQVANLIREGKTTKDIADLLSLAISTIHTHRDNIRIKLGIKNKKYNLSAYLKNLQK